MLTDDYTLAILPLSCLQGDNAVGGRCPGPGQYGETYRQVMEEGVLGYRLFTYYGLMRAQFGEDVERKVRDRHIGMLEPSVNIVHLLAMIETAVNIGTVTTSTCLGEIVTPVEMNVALTLLLGLPASPHYVAGPGARTAEIARMAPDVDWYFADCLGRVRQGMTEAFAR